MLVQFYEEKSAFSASGQVSKKREKVRKGQSKQADALFALFPPHFLPSFILAIPSLGQHFAQVAHGVGVALKKLDMVHDARYQRHAHAPFAALPDVLA